MGEHKWLDPTVKQPVGYCVPLWLRDEQVRVNTARRDIGRLADTDIVLADTPATPLRSEPIAIVCYGPSLADTWEAVRRFPYRITCSGAHRFLLERGLVPTWHVEVDPRPHKIALLGPPHPDVIYLPASTCHPSYFDHLVAAGVRVKLWHVFDTDTDATRLLPANEWAMTGGASAGLRAMTMARMLGFTDLHVFGMDGCEGATGKHAAAHPSQPTGHALVQWEGVTYRTTASMLECARQTWHELNQLTDVTATFYGEGLVQAMSKTYVRVPVPNPFIGFSKPELISSTYRDLNARLHRENLAYGVGGARHAETVRLLASKLPAPFSVLDYGCGKGLLAKALPFPIWEYDPAIPDKAESPRPADLLVCTDVLEHVEPDRLAFVLADLARCCKQIGFLTIHTGPAQKTLPDGRNTHLIQRDLAWWKTTLRACFTVGTIRQAGAELYVVVGPKSLTKPKEAAA
jgi:hypothetical protein